MAGKKDKKASLLPKQLEGVKLGKGLRKKLVDLASQPLVADLLASGLIALAARLKGEPAPAKAEGKPAAPANDVAEKVKQMTAEVAASLAVPAASAPAKKPATAKAAKPAKATKPAKSAAAKPKSAAKPPRAPAKPKAAAKLASPKTTH